MFRNRSLAAVLAGFFAATTVQAQVFYNGYNLGPDYGAMLQAELAKSQALGQQMEQQTQAMVAQAMQDPQCLAMYQQHLAQGGQTPFPQFAYMYLATGHFSPQGIANFQRSERQNQQREYQAWQGVQAAEQARGAAQVGYMNGYSDNQATFRENLGGYRSWVTPNGATVSLPYIGPNTPWTDQYGNTYARDDSGQYYMQDPNGYWQRLAPAR